MHPELLNLTVRACREYMAVRDCHAKAPPTERLIATVVQLADQLSPVPDCTEPNRAVCPRLCIDFCNKAETARELAPPAPRLLVDRLWAALQAAGLTATETRQYIRNLKNAAGGEHALGTLLPRGGDGFIWCGFTWQDSPEGYDYWNAVACRLDTRSFYD